MKKLVKKVTFVGILFLFPFSAFLQEMDNIDWEKKAEEYHDNPQKLKEKFASYEKQIKRLKEEKEATTKKLHGCLSEKSYLQYTMENIHQKYETGYTGPVDTGKINKQNPPPEGLVFRVQIGAFKKFDASSFFQGDMTLKLHQVGDLNRYQIGDFNSIEKAKTFAEDIRSMGIRDAWVFPLYNGKYIPVEKAEKMK